MMKKIIASKQKKQKTIPFEDRIKGFHKAFQDKLMRVYKNEEELLDLIGCKIGDEIVCALAAALRENNTLKMIYLNLL